MSAENNIAIPVVAFEGPHRVGKETNIQKLQEYFTNKGVPCKVLRGDGSRTGQNNNEGDPYSIFWQRLNSDLHKPETPKDLWNYSSYILAKEFLICKRVYFPREIHKQQKNFGVIILDRSILSRTLIPREILDQVCWKDQIPNILYKKPAVWKGKEICIDDVAPDLILNLVAPIEVLLSRLDKSDPKYTFRKGNLLKRYDWYIDSVNYIPDHLKCRVVTIDTNRNTNEVFEEIVSVIDQKIDLNEK